ncbi:MAG: hypothetical protein KatS3mg119_2033 [Rhodothalassiaceae bacterium]|nr:MAG: hypothetical protein KatS3mg119_2033 [Rhodothalassiaceae bacterium]
MTRRRHPRPRPHRRRGEEGLDYRLLAVIGTGIALVLIVYFAFA